MMNEQDISEVRSALQQFQDGDTARDVNRLDEFMALFLPEDGIEMIGIGAARRFHTIHWAMPVH